MSRQPDPRNVRDFLLTAGHPEDEVEAMLAAAAAKRELNRLAHVFDGAMGLRFEDFASRAQSRARVALRLVSDVALSRDQQHTEATPAQPHVLEAWRAHALKWGFEP